MNQPASPPRVLVVEDEAIVALNISDVLADLGYAVTDVAAGLIAGLAAVQRGGFDVGLLDVNLKGETSMAIADRLSEAGIPYLFATGYGASMVAERHRGAPVLAKPFAVAELAAALRSALAGGSARKSG